MSVVSLFGDRKREFRGVHRFAPAVAAITAKDIIVNDVVIVVVIVVTLATATAQSS